MTDETKNLKLFKYNTRTDRKEKFSVDDALNDNWDKVDEAVNANKESIAEVKEEVAGIISPPPIEFESGKFLSNDGNKLVWKEVEAGTSEEELALKEDKANKGVPGGYAGLNARGKVFGSQLDLSSKQDVLVPGEGIKIVGNTISSTVTGGASEEELALKEDKANKGVANGYAGLDAEGKVPTSQLPNTSSGLEVCDIGMALYVDETKGLRRYLNGQIVDINTNTQAFLNRLLEIKNTNPDYFATEENWQSEATLNIDGCVYKFVLNYSGETVVSVRLPKYPDYVEINAGGTLPVVGNGSSINFYTPSYPENGTTGLRLDSGTAPAYSNYQAVSREYTLGVTTDPTKSGLETTLKQTKLKMRYFIQIATGSETENNIINEIELNNPFSLFDSKYSDHELNNLSWLKSEGQWNAKTVYTDAYDKLLKVYNGTETVEGLSVKLSTETYTDYDFVLNTIDETFRLPLKTKLASGKAVVGNGITLGFTNGTSNYGVGISDNTHSLGTNTEVYGKNVGSSTFFTGYSDTQSQIAGVTTDPTKSGLELSDSGLYLYFYVGETVQNANLIDAGRIGEQLANKQDKCIHIIDTYVNGTSGYRTWSDGYCEQYGVRGAVGEDSTLVITLLKPYKDTNYNVFDLPYFTNNTTQYRSGCGYKQKTTSSFTLLQDTFADNGGNWFTCGYIA